MNGIQHPGLTTNQEVACSNHAGCTILFNSLETLLQASFFIGAHYQRILAQIHFKTSTMKTLLTIILLTSSVFACKTTATLYGQMTDRNRGVSRARVLIVDVTTGSGGQPIHFLTTNAFGFYKVELPNCNNDYEVIPFHRRYYFDPVKIDNFSDDMRIDFEGYWAL